MLPGYARITLFGNRVWSPLRLIRVHIRRTDKFITHPVEAYMDHVERWWNREEQRNQLRGNVKNFKRQIYVATDASSVIPKLRSRYSKYQIVHNKVSTTYASGSKRRSDPGLEGLLTDIHILSKCDFVVCGYSSNVCRLVYHLMQSLYADPSDRLYSIDGGYNPLWTTPLTRNRYITIITHRSNTRLNELDVNPGDILEIYDMAQEDPQVKLKGYYWMQNLKTKAEGLVPSYKVKPYPRKSRFSFLD
ncbi:unnamed protein product [Clavelina lepadiformis]|uniref:GT23 domain-containing protein n=1 Tax=Clavelina lepadiformis TaxID=159417 RepID=A0ABP0FAC5_CLALP